MTTDTSSMAVGSVSSGGGLPAGGVLAAAQASMTTNVALLDAALDMTAQLTEQLMASMQAASPTGSGGSVDTWA